MTHKEEMDYLKKHDPILYSELTSDPCHGSPESYDGCLFFMAIGVIGAIIGLIIILIK